MFTLFFFETLLSFQKVKSLGSGFDACRCGDLESLKNAIDFDHFNPLTALDNKGASCMLWAAGGGHLDLCRYLCDVIGLNPNPDSNSSCDSGGDSSIAVQKGRRGYNGRTALHYAARNGHVHVVRWLVEEKGCDIDRSTEDGTTAFCWAVWQVRHDSYSHIRFSMTFNLVIRLSLSVHLESS